MPHRKYRLDKLDYQIIQEPCTNARNSATDNARKIGSNDCTIRKRIDRLIGSGVFRLTAILDPGAYGYLTTADILLRADPAYEREILEQLKQIPEVTHVAIGQGSTEISLQSRFKNNEKLQNFFLSYINWTYRCESDRLRTRAAYSAEYRYVVAFLSRFRLNDCY